MSAALDAIKALVADWSGVPLGTDFFGNPLGGWAPVDRVRALIPALEAELAGPEDGWSERDEVAYQATLPAITEHEHHFVARSTMGDPYESCDCGEIRDLPVPTPLPTEADDAEALTKIISKAVDISEQMPCDEQTARAVLAAGYVPPAAHAAALAEAERAGAEKGWGKGLVKGLVLGGAGVHPSVALDTANPYAKGGE